MLNDSFNALKRKLSFDIFEFQLVWKNLVD